MAARSILIFLGLALTSAHVAHRRELPIVWPNGVIERAGVLHADANDQRTPAGRLVDGELRVELDVVDLTWSPRGPNGPLVPAIGFAERGRAPQVPGPLLRMRAGIPVRISVRNTLARAVRVRGLSDRVPGDTAVNGLPGFTRQPALRLAPGEEREVRFTPTRAVTSFYFARLLATSTDTLPENRLTSPSAAEGNLVGGFVVDPVDTAPPANERIFVITSYGSPLEHTNVSMRVSFNGLSWPFTERLTYNQGDTVHWRVINASGVYHPLHLHGFYFAVSSRGDGQADTLVSTPRPLEVTEAMLDFSTMQLSWVADRPGNWLFHCHLIRHSSATQRYSAESSALASSSDMMGDQGMAGLILGITIRPRTPVAVTPPANARRLDLWTGTRPDVFGDSTGYGFVLQRGDRPPAPDSIVVPGSPLILQRGEPTRIVVHNRLPFPLGVHWHGLELESYYDGVANWSGQPGKMRGMIPAGDTMSVYITPPRSGTFMYHTHGELGARLAQGLYGTLIVQDRGHELNADTDRLFVLASRGATLNAEAAINGRGIPPVEHFSVGKTYRLRFTQISLDDVKNVRLLLNGKPVTWRPYARDGATLPAARRVETEATQRMDAGETYDFEWTPATAGIYLLDVATTYYPARFDSTLQRMAFGVGPVTESDLRIAATGTSLAVGDPSTATLNKLVGTYVSSTTVPSPDVVSVWEDSTGLAVSQTKAGVESPAHCLIPLADGSFVPGTCANGFMNEAVPLEHLRFEGSHVTTGAGPRERSFQRVAALKLPDAALARFVGHYEFGFAIELRNGVLTMINSGRPGEPPGRDDSVGTPLSPVSPSRLVGRVGPFQGLFEFTFEDGKAVAFSMPAYGFTAKRVDARVAPQSTANSPPDLTPVAAVASWLTFDAPPGEETPLTNAIMATDSRWRRDDLGNLLMTVGSGHPRRLIACGLDHVGYVVSEITDQGYLRLRRSGSGATHPLWDQFHQAQQIRVLTKNGSVPGVVAVDNAHFAEEHRGDATVVNVDQLWVDIGVGSRAEATALGVSLIDPVVRDLPPWLYADYAAGADASGRAGCAAIASIARAAAHDTHSSGETVFLLSVQSRFAWTGLRSALARFENLDEITIVVGAAVPERLAASLAERVRTAFSVKLVKSVRASARFAGSLVESVRANDLDSLLTAVGTAAQLTSADVPWIALARPAAVEVGYTVRSIDHDGMVTLAPQGGFNGAAWEGQPALLWLDRPSTSGAHEPVTPASLAGVFVPREQATLRRPDVMRAWFGLDSVALAARGVRAGLAVAAYKRGERLAATRFTARALDDRAGDTALLLALAGMNPATLNHKVIFVWSVEEEIGQIGANMVAHHLGTSVHRAYAIDTFVSSDTPLESPAFAFAPLGHGPVLIAMDNQTIVLRGERERIIALAHNNHIPLQVGTTRGGSDVSGATAAQLGWPGRYSHSPAEVLDLNDLKALARMVRALAQ